MIVYRGKRLAGPHFSVFRFWFRWCGFCDYRRFLDSGGWHYRCAQRRENWNNTRTTTTTTRYYTFTFTGPERFWNFRLGFVRESGCYISFGQGEKPFVGRFSGKRLYCILRRSVSRVWDFLIPDHRCCTDNMPTNTGVCPCPSRT